MVSALTIFAVAVLAIAGSSYAYEFSSRTEWGDYPYLVTFDVNNGKSCAGSIISDKWILTSSSCIISPDTESTDKSYYYINAGRVNDYTNYAPHVHIPITKEQLFSHEKFNPTTYENNIGLIKLREGLNFSRYLNTISIGDMGMPITDGIVVGWGDWDGDFNEHAGIKYSTVKISANETCKSHLEKYNCAIHEHIEIYRKSTNNVYCTTRNDSIGHMGYTRLDGGPVIMRHSDGMAMQIGVLSWASELGVEDGPGSCTNDSAILVYTDVSKYISWINDVKSRNTASYSGLSFALIALSIVASSLF